MNELAINYRYFGVSRTYEILVQVRSIGLYNIYRHVWRGLNYFIQFYFSNNKFRLKKGKWLVFLGNGWKSWRVMKQFWRRTYTWSWSTYVENRDFLFFVCRIQHFIGSSDCKIYSLVYYILRCSLLSFENGCSPWKNMDWKFFQPLCRRINKK